MRITLLTAHISRRAAGVFASLLGLGRALRQAGVDTRVVGLRDPKEPEPQEDGLVVAACPVLGPQAFGYAPGLPAALASAGADLVHAQGLWMYPSRASLAWSRRTGRPRMISAHGMLDSWALARSAWKKRLATHLFEDAHLRGAACLHALCAAEAQALRAYGLRNPICVIPNGVALAPASGEGTEGGPRTLLFLGRLHPKKGVAELLRAWSLVEERAERAGWRLVVAGPDDRRHGRELKRLANGLGLGESVRFAGPCAGADKGRALRAAGAFILPSFSEGLPMAALEAWSHGRPVLMTERCNLTEGFAAGAAIRIEPRPESIAESLLRLFAMSDGERHAMGAAGRRLVEADFTWPSVALRMRAVYAWVLGGGAPPACVLTD